MNRRHPPKLFRRPHSTALWARYYDARGKLRRVSTGTTDPVEAQDFLDRRVAEASQPMAIPATHSLSQAFQFYEDRGGLDPVELGRFRHLRPFLLEALEANGVTRIGNLGSVMMHELLGWLHGVHMMGASVRESSANRPVYEGPFRLTDNDQHEAFVFACKVLAFAKEPAS